MFQTVLTYSRIIRLRRLIVCHRYKWNCWQGSRSPVQRDSPLPFSIPFIPTAQTRFPIACEWNHCEGTTASQASQSGDAVFYSAAEHSGWRIVPFFQPRWIISPCCGRAAQQMAFLKVHQVHFLCLYILLSGGTYFKVQQNTHWKPPSQRLGPDNNPRRPYLTKSDWEPTTNHLPPESLTEQCDSCHGVDKLQQSGHKASLKLGVLCTVTV